jgi:hypothetical protein
MDLTQFYQDLRQLELNIEANRERLAKLGKHPHPTASKCRYKDIAPQTANQKIEISASCPQTPNANLEFNIEPKGSDA